MIVERLTVAFRRVSNVVILLEKHFFLQIGLCELLSNVSVKLPAGNLSSFDASEWRNLLLVDLLLDFSASVCQLSSNVSGFRSRHPLAHKV